MTVLSTLSFTLAMLIFLSAPVLEFLLQSLVPSPAGFIHHNLLLLQKSHPPGFRFRSEVLVFEKPNFVRFILK